MVAIQKIINNGLLLASQSVYKDVGAPNLAATEQYNIVKYLGGAGPYIQNPGYGISTDVPDQCTIEQVHMISRHGERFPIKSHGAIFEDIYKKFQNHSKPFVGELAFLNDYEYFVKDKNYYEKETSPMNSQGFAGTNTAYRHGTAFRSRYSDLFDDEEPLTVFTANSGRCHVTADYFARGLFGDDYSDETVEWAILAEEEELGANSLTPNVACKNNEPDAWTKLEAYNTSFFTEAGKRITKGNDGLTLNATEVMWLNQWCAFELNVKGYSPFCNLFTNEEFIKTAYYLDLLFYYANGPGYNLTATIGAPYLNATLQYLKEDKPPQKIVLAFTHDTNIEHLHSALGLFEPDEDLPFDHIPFPNPYPHIELMPMGSRMYIEKYSCGNDTYIRHIVNDAVIPLKPCHDGPGFSCKLSDYEEYINSRLKGKDYATQCGAEGVPDEVTFLWDYKTKNYTAEDIDA